MALEAGTRLGPYDILSPLGAGGMGEVYLAFDSKLDRNVAIKVLPETMTRDKERVARFEREAKLLASLNHPNIAAIHGFDDSEGIRFLIMEYVEGETLSQRLDGGPFPVEDALDVAKQMAEALEAAHEKGVIHRDLKPGNVMVRPDGTVKVLDFGLAKAMAEESSGPVAADAPTITVNHTRPGVILGTAAYMSPEQARGKPLDKRTDIWSLGCVLYECLTGKRAFDGGTATDVMSQIITSEPDFTLLPDKVPVSAERLLRRCFDKDSKKRLRDAGEIRVLIDEYQVAPSSEKADVFSRQTHRKRYPTAPCAWAVVALLGIALTYSQWGLDSRTLPRRVSRWSIALPQKSRVDTMGYGGKYEYSKLLAVSPDGLHVAFTVRDEWGYVDLRVRDVDKYSSRPLPGTTNARAPFFSPDGHWVGFLADRIIKRVALGGGSPQDVCEVDSASFDASWAADGETIVYATDEGLWRVAASGGVADRLTAPQVDDGEVGHHLPRITPDGRHVLFSVSTTPVEDLALLSLDTLKWKTVVRDASQGQLFPPDRLVFARTGELMGVRFDVETGEMLGTPVSLLESVHTTPGLGGVVVTHFDVSDTGTLAYLPQSNEAVVDQLLWVGQDGEETVITSGPGTWVHPRLSPDGHRVSFDVHSLEGMRDIHLYDLERCQRRQFTRGGSSWESVWRPDGDYISYMSGHPSAGWSIWWARTDYSTDSAEVLHPSSHAIPMSWTPDGQSLLYYELAEGGIWTLSPNGDSEAKLLLKGLSNERFPTLSWDGKWIAYVADESDRREVFVQSFPGLGPKHRISNNGGGEPVWSRDGSRLFFREGNQMLSAQVEYEPSFRASTPVVLFSGEYDAAPLGHQHYDISLDGKKFLMIKHGQPSGPSELRVVQNWFEELEMKLATQGNR